jgi:hypothetical protein
MTKELFLSNISFPVLVRNSLLLYNFCCGLVGALWTFPSHARAALVLYITLIGNGYYWKDDEMKGSVAYEHFGKGSCCASGKAFI